MTRRIFRSRGKRRTSHRVRFVDLTRRQRRDLVFRVKHEIRRCGISDLFASYELKYEAGGSEDPQVRFLSRKCRWTFWNASFRSAMQMFDWKLDSLAFDELGAQGIERGKIWFESRREVDGRRFFTMRSEDRRYAGHGDKTYRQIHAEAKERICADAPPSIEVGTRLDDFLSPGREYGRGLNIVLDEGLFTLAAVDAAVRRFLDDGEGSQSWGVVSGEGLAKRWAILRKEGRL